LVQKYTKPTKHRVYAHTEKYHPRTPPLGWNIGQCHFLGEDMKRNKKKGGEWEIKMKKEER
jgi:hypothetical protein